MFCKKSSLIILEDLTFKYGNGENYVVGYYARNNVEFLYYISLILHTPMADGNDEIILENIEIIELDGLRALVFSKSAAEEAALALGYTSDMYYIRFAFVPVGADGSFDYAITFTEDNATEITDSGTVRFVGSGIEEVFVITPVETETWTVYTERITGFDPHLYLYDSEGNLLYQNDDYSGWNSRITYTLEAGKTYTVKVKRHSGEHIYGEECIVVFVRGDA